MLSQKTRSSLTVTIGTILIVVGTLVLVAFASGYNFDILRGEIYATGLALLNTNPSGATITINDRTLTQKTPYRLENIKTGPLKVEYQRNDYHSWQTTFFVRAGEVTFADYALLIPKKIDAKTIQAEQSFNQIFNNPDANKAFAVSSSPAAVFEIREDSSLRKVADLPLDASFKPPIASNLITINNEGSALLLQLNYEGSLAKQWLNTGSGEFIDLTPQLEGLSQLRFNPRNNRELFGLNTNGNLVRVSINDRRAEIMPIGNIGSFNIDGEHLYCLEKLQPASAGQFLVRYDLNATNRYVLAQFSAATQPWEIKLSKLHGQTNIALSEPENGNLYMVRQLDGKILTSLVGSAIGLPEFSKNGRFISFKQGNEFRTIDLEFTERFRVENPNIQSTAWLTDFQLLITKSDGLYIVDYTGQNLIKIPPNTNGADQLQVTTDRNGKFVYFLLNSKLHSYDLEPQEGLINFR